MKCVVIRCGFESMGSLEKDEVEWWKLFWKLSKVVVICFFFMVVEVVGGLYVNSLVIFMDVVYLLIDVVGFVIFLFVIWVLGWEVILL